MVEEVFKDIYMSPIYEIETIGDEDHVEDEGGLNQGGA